MAKWVRVAHGGGGAFGLLADNGAVAIHRGDMFDRPSPTGEIVPPEAVRLRAPVRPGKFIGLWNNFHELAHKQGNTIPTEPLFWIVATISCITPTRSRSSSWRMRSPARNSSGSISDSGDVGPRSRISGSVIADFTCLSSAGT